MILWKNSIKHIRKNIISFLSLFLMMFVCSVSFLSISSIVEQIETNFNQISSNGKIQQFAFTNYLNYSFSPQAQPKGYSGKVDYTQLNKFLKDEKIISGTTSYEKKYNFQFENKQILSVLNNDQNYDFRAVMDKINISYPEKLTDSSFTDQNATGTEQNPFQVYTFKKWEVLNANLIDSNNCIEIGGYYFKIIGTTILPDYLSPVIGSSILQNPATSSYMLTSTSTFTKIQNSLSGEYSYLNTEMDFRFNDIQNAEGREFQTRLENLSQSLSKYFVNDSNPVYSASIPVLQNSWQNMPQIHKLISILDAAKIILVFFISSVIFICILSLLIISKKIIQESQTQIGVLKSLGYKNHELIFNYSIFSLTCGVTAGIIGTVVGFFVQGSIERMYDSKFAFDLNTYYANPLIILASAFIPILVMSIFSFIFNTIYICKDPIKLIKRTDDYSVSRIGTFIIKKISNTGFTFKFLVSSALKSSQKIFTIFLSVLFSSFLILFSLTSVTAFSTAIKRDFNNLSFSYQINFNENSVTKPLEGNYGPGGIYDNVIKTQNGNASYNIDYNFNLLNSKYYNTFEVYGDTMAQNPNNWLYSGHFICQQWFDNNINNKSIDQINSIAEYMKNTNLTGYFLSNRDMTEEGKETYKAVTSKQISDIVNYLTPFAALNPDIGYVVQKLKSIETLFKTHEKNGTPLYINLGFTPTESEDYKFNSISGSLGGVVSKVNATATLNAYSNEKGSPGINKFISDFSSSDIDELNNFVYNNEMPVFINYSMKLKYNLVKGSTFYFNNKKCYVLGIKQDFPNDQIFTSRLQYNYFFNPKYTPTNLYPFNAFMSEDGDASDYIGKYMSVQVQNNPQSFLKNYEADPNIQIFSPITSVFDKTKIIKSIYEVLNLANILLTIVIFAASVLSLSLLFSITNLVVNENRRFISLMQVLGYRIKEINFLFLGFYIPFVLISVAVSVPLTMVVLNLFAYKLTGALGFGLDFVISPLNAVITLIGISFILMLSFWFSRKMISKEPITNALKTFDS